MENTSETMLEVTIAELRGNLNRIQTEIDNLYSRLSVVRNDMPAPVLKENTTCGKAISNAPLILSLEDSIEVTKNCLQTLREIDSTLVL